jgi:hypothetical protein
LRASNSGEECEQVQTNSQPKKKRNTTEKEKKKKKEKREREEPQAWISDREAANQKPVFLHVSRSGIRIRNYHQGGKDNQTNAEHKKD